MSSIARKFCAVALSASLALGGVPALALADAVAQPEDQMLEATDVSTDTIKAVLKRVEEIYKKSSARIDKLTELSDFAKAIYKNAIFEFAKNDDMIELDNAIQTAIELQKKTAEEIAADPDEQAAQAEVADALVRILGLDDLADAAAETAAELIINGQMLRMAGEQIDLTSDEALVIAPMPGTYDGTEQTPAMVVCLYGDSALLMLDPETDYTMACTNNTNSGIATATIKGMGMFTGSIDVPFLILPADLAETDAATQAEATTVTGLADKTYTGEKQTQELEVTYNGKTLVENKDYKLIYANNRNAGTAKVMIYGLSNYEASRKTLTFNIAKAANPLKVTAKSASAKASALKKKAQTLAASKVVKVSGAEGKVTYKKVSGNSKITVASNGKVTLKKGLAKSTYKVKIAVTAAGGDNFEKGTQNVTCTIKVK